MQKNDHTLIIEILYSKQVQSFLGRSPLSEEEVDNLLRRAVCRLIGLPGEPVDLKKLHGNLKNLFRIRKGDVRIIFSCEHGRPIRVHVITMDHRGGVYRLKH